MISFIDNTSILVILVAVGWIIITLIILLNKILSRINSIALKVLIISFILALIVNLIELFKWGFDFVMMLAGIIITTIICFIFLYPTYLLAIFLIKKIKQKNCNE